MGYLETIEEVINNIDTQKDMYIAITNATSLHVYKEELDKTWYRVVCEVIEDGKYTEESMMSACNMEDLKRIVGISYIHCNELYDKFKEREVVEEDRE